jgi:putative Holliday junction resolvase
MSDLRGRVLAIDYGEKNIGLAYCDELGMTVNPLPSLPNHGRKDFFQKLRNTIQALSIQELILGIPVNMDGTSGDAVHRMEQLLENLRTQLDIPVKGIDERLSTVEALDIWHTMNSRQQKKYRTVDSLAAAFILERYLKEF